MSKYIFNMKFRDFLNARKFARSLNLKNRKEWDGWCADNLHQKPKDIPVVPNACYKKNGWISYDDWLGVKNK